MSSVLSELGNSSGAVRGHCGTAEDRRVHTSRNDIHDADSDFEDQATSKPKRFVVNSYMYYIIYL